MEKNKNKFEVVKMTQIHESYLTNGTLKALSGRELFTDTDFSLGEKIYSGDVFESILGEESEMGESPIRITDEKTLAQIEELAKEIETEYIQITKI